MRNWWHGMSRQCVHRAELVSLKTDASFVLISFVVECLSRSGNFQEDWWSLESNWRTEWLSSQRKEPKMERRWLFGRKESHVMCLQTLRLRENMREIQRGWLMILHPLASSKTRICVSRKQFVQTVSLTHTGKTRNESCREKRMCIQSDFSFLAKRRLPAATHLIALSFPQWLTLTNDSLPAKFNDGKRVEEREGWTLTYDALVRKLRRRWMSLPKILLNILSKISPVHQESRFSS